MHTTTTYLQEFEEAFAGCRTFTDSNDTYAALFDKLLVRWPDAWSPDPEARRARRELSEAHRRCDERVTIDVKGDHYWQSAKEYSGTTRPTTPRKRSARTSTRPLVRPVEHDDGSMTITCRTCHQEKSTKKFPTTKPGVRDDRCRECRDAAKVGAS